MSIKFLSFLGTSSYLECSYYFNNPDTEFYPTRFVQISIIRKLIQDKILTKESKILIFATDSAYEKNWFDSQDSTGESLPGLNSAVRNLISDLNKQGYKFPEYERIKLPEGKSETELWEIFHILIENVEDNDKIYFDITHSFRSLPLLSLIVLNYLRVIKNVELKKIFYGAFEAMGEISSIKEKDIQQRKAPIFDLTPFVDLFYWTTAAHDFLKTGNAELLTELTKRKAQPILRAKKGKDKAAHKLNELSKNLETFSHDIKISNGKAIFKDLTSLYNILFETFEYSREIPPFQYLFRNILDRFSNFSPRGTIIDKTNFAIEFCFNNGLIQQGYTLLEENLITYGCKKFELDYLSVKHRKLFTSALHIYEKKLEPEDWNLQRNWNHQEQKELIRKIISKNLSNFVSIKNVLFPLRNSLNHAAFDNKNHIKYKTFQTKGIDILNQFKKMIKNDTK